MQFLMLNGADVHMIDAFGSTALHYAAFANQPGIVELLLLHGAEVDAETPEGVTPMGIAQEHGYDEVCALLE